MCVCVCVCVCRCVCVCEICSVKLLNTFMITNLDQPITFFKIIVIAWVI